MALGDLKGGDFDLVYRAKGTGTLVNGNIVAFDSSGNVIPATASTYGKHGVLTALTHSVSGTTYYGICMRGRIVCEAGGTIKPNKLVVSDSAGLAIEATTTVTATVAQSEVQMLWRIVGRYIRKDGDNEYAASDAATNDAIIIEVGAY
jgi:hypothetical protein